MGRRIFQPRPDQSFKDYLVARRIKHEKFMTPGAAANEKLHTFLEGTALYSNTKMMMFIKDRKYKPALTSKEDPFFYGFKFADSYIYARSVADIEKTMNDSLDTIQKWYTFGLFQCLGMDRFFPGWKKDVLEYERNLDEVMAEKLKLSEAETAAIAERLKTKYDYDALYAKHEGVITLAATQGSEITLVVSGKDESAALDALVGLIDGKFDEKE